jgi:hypothetical protein
VHLLVPLSCDWHCGCQVRLWLQHSNECPTHSSQQPAAIQLQLQLLQLQQKRSHCRQLLHHENMT